MQWCQKFEYAYNHWFVKSTEYITGCVLCSPGNFSLFRGEALMSDNVMTTYATVSTKPFHRIQYDQGEDRWLCSLLLQEGWGVEYLAASGKKNDFSLHQKIRVKLHDIAFLSNSWVAKFPSISLICLLRVFQGLKLGAKGMT